MHATRCCARWVSGGRELPARRLAALYGCLHRSTRSRARIPSGLPSSECELCESSCHRFNSSTARSPPPAIHAHIGTPELVTPPLHVGSELSLPPHGR